MNKFKYYFILLLAGISMISCNKNDDDEPVVVPLRDYTEQYKADNDSIEKYLKTNYIQEVTANYDITISKIPAGGTQISIWDQKTYELKTRDVFNDNIMYKVYYLVLRKGVGQAPMNTDRIFATYDGNLLNGTSFDSSDDVPGIWNLDGQGDRGVFVDGWKEIFPQFNIGTSTTDANGVQTYDNYGAGVMFLPSGLAYYASATENIPAYSPLVFSFRLFDFTRTDHDLDGVSDYNEDVNHDGYVYNFSDKVAYPNPPANLIDDTDGDGIPDFLDYDDDGDGYTTFFEVTKPKDAAYSGISTFYPFDPVLDNPKTLNVDETEIWGIPRRPTGALADPSKPESITNPRAYIDEDYKAAGRLRIHVDKTYPYQKN
ncbi:hypothetical protein [Flavobacterium aquidurense]|uniref:FKBP-type peptidyl-prolyl cis-trans isomerase n=1 Tax=Flavobacterium aquidurense TaxID=362413 RepID=UPI0028616F81|nr:hypothetical protein [Flavobacterium aquidurense]MDR7373021.1 hypothetical protein [Flavobacterium aquidurense]